ncbi:Type IV pilus assembly protein TapC [Chlamydiales bacterium SCGC AG-110-P3]|nr:Type IV pilus assembly protein TapC [Chlamydiales bacterium SCGC AG-110-P3]
MSLFNYNAFNNTGQRVKGTIEAGSEKEAKSRLRERGLMLSGLSPATLKGRRSALHGDVLATFTVLLAQLIDAGVPLYDSLVALEEQYRGEKFHSTLTSLCDAIKEGHSLSEAMAQHPDSFDALYCSMVEAGETSGALAMVLERLTKHLESQQKMRRQISTAMVYPAVLGGFSFVVVGLLLLFVVPSIEAVFEGRELNAYTRVVLSVSHFAQDTWWWLLPLFGAAMTYLVIRLRQPSGQQWMQGFVLKLPILGQLAVQASVARLCRTLASMLTGGVSLVDSLRIASGVMKNVVLEAEVNHATERVIQGSSLSRELGRSRWIPSMVARMVSIGEESGTSSIMFNKIADIYEGQLDKTLQRVMALAQPVILIVMGIVVGSILLAILLPLTDVSGFS